MNRRSFLQALGAAIGTALVNPVYAYTQSSKLVLKFDPALQYGNFIPYLDGADPEIVAGEMVRNARSFIPPGIPFSTWVLKPMPDNEDPMLRVGYLCWKYDPRGPSYMTRGGAGRWAIPRQFVS